MICSACGTENENGFKFCVKCGSNMENPSEVSIWSRDYFLQLANMVKLTI